MKQLALANTRVGVLEGALHYITPLSSAAVHTVAMYAIAVAPTPQSTESDSIIMSMTTLRETRKGRAKVSCEDVVTELRYIGEVPRSCLVC